MVDSILNKTKHMKNRSKSTIKLVQKITPVLGSQFNR